MQEEMLVMSARRDACNVCRTQRELQETAKNRHARLELFEVLCSIMGYKAKEDVRSGSRKLGRR